MDEWTNELMNKWVNDETTEDRPMRAASERTNEWMNRLINEGINGWMNN